MKECDVCHINKQIVGVYYDFYKPFYEKIKENQSSCNDCLYKASKRREKERYRKKYPEKMKEKFICSCGVELRKDGKSRHEKTKKHIKWIEENVKEEEKE